MAIVEGQKVMVKWSTNNKKYYEAFNTDGAQKYKYTKINEIFLVDINDLTKGSKSIIKCICNNCESIVEKQAYLAFKTERHFCNSECKYAYQRKYGSFNNTQEFYNCDCCNKEIKVKQYVLREKTEGKRKNIFCSQDCKRKWESENKRGANNHNYNRIRKTCEYCSKEYEVPQSQKDRNKYCSVECRQLNSRNKIECECLICKMPLLKTKSQLEKSKSGHVFCSNECVGKYNTMTRKKELIDKVCEICDKPYSVKQSYASKSVTCSVECQHEWQRRNLCGENANNYNHDFKDRRYNCDWCGIETTIKSPYKIKHTYILNNYNAEILYLWEEDISNDINMCRQLILLYIKNKGNLKNYHSFNYYLDSNGEAQLKNEEIIPYMDYPIEELKKIVNIVGSKRMSKKQLDKWITFNCEQCGEEKEQLKSRYNKAEHHFCSLKCSHEYNKGKKRKSSK